MFIQNAVLKSINAEGLSFPLAEGSVVSVGGVTGIVPTTLNVRPATNRIYVAVAGTIDLTSDANKGVTFTEEQIKALGGDFNFVPATESPTELPAVTSTDNGKVLTVSSGKWSAQTPAGGLPAVTNSDRGKALMVNDGNNNVTWKELVKSFLFYDTGDGIMLTSGSYSDIKSAISKRQPILFSFSDESGDLVRYSNNFSIVQGDSEYIAINFITVDAGALYVDDIQITSNGTVSYTEYHVALTT